MLQLVEDLVSIGPPYRDAENEFNQESRKIQFKDYASLVFCVLSHGTKGDSVSGVDGENVYINQLKYAFNNIDCPDLYGKPKIFIIQACRGSYEQPPLDDDIHRSDELFLVDDFDLLDLGIIANPPKYLKRYIFIGLFFKFKKKV